MKMRQKRAWMLWIVLLITIAWTLPVQAAQPGKLVAGGTYTLQSGETLNEDLTVIGGNVTLEDDSTVNGNIALTAGTMNISGTVNGDIVVTSATLSLLSGAEVNGKITLAAGVLNRDGSAIVNGEIEESGNIPMVETRPITLPFTLTGLWAEGLPGDLIWLGLGYIGNVFLLAALAVLGAVFISEPMGRLGRAASQQPLATFALGLMTLIVAVISILFLTFTLIFIPLAILIFLALLFLTVYGWLGIGFEVGERFAAQFKQVWAAPLSAGLGTLFFSAVIIGVGWIPCLGWAIVSIVIMIGIGATLLTRFGTTDYLP
jgi:hypothetical protein